MAVESEMTVESERKIGRLSAEEVIESISVQARFWMRGKTTMIRRLIVVIVAGTLALVAHDFGIAGEQNRIPTYKVEEPLVVGYWGYTVRSYEWVRSIGTGYFQKYASPGSQYLRVFIVAVNGDKTPSTLPPFKLVDDDGYEYEQSVDGLMESNYFGILERANPMTPKTGYILFEVPPKSYWLVFSGGYLSVHQARVRIEGLDDVHAAVPSPAKYNDAIQEYTKTVRNKLEEEGLEQLEVKGHTVRVKWTEAGWDHPLGSGEKVSLQSKQTRLLYIRDKWVQTLNSYGFRKTRQDVKIEIRVGSRLVAVTPTGSSRLFKSWDWS